MRSHVAFKEQSVTMQLLKINHWTEDVYSSHMSLHLNEDTM